MSGCNKLIYTPTSPDQYNDPNASADVQGYDQPEVNASADASASLTGLNNFLFDLFAPLRTLADK